MAGDFEVQGHLHVGALLTVGRNEGKSVRRKGVQSATGGREGRAEVGAEEAEPHPDESQEADCAAPCEGQRPSREGQGGVSEMGYRGRESGQVCVRVPPGNGEHGCDHRVHRRGGPRPGTLPDYAREVQTGD